MTKKDYIALAYIFRKHGFNEDSYFLDEVMDYFKKDNPNFDRDKFMEAIKGKQTWKRMN